MEEDKKVVPPEKENPVKKAEILEEKTIVEGTEPKISDKNVEEKPKKEKSGFAIASMVLGIISIIFFGIFYISIPTAILAIIFGIMTIKSTRRGMAITGLITGIIGFLLAMVIFILLIITGITAINRILNGTEGILDRYDRDYDYNYHYDYDDHYDYF